MPVVPTTLNHVDHNVYERRMLYTGPNSCVPFSDEGWTGNLREYQVPTNAQLQRHRCSEARRML